MSGIDAGLIERLIDLVERSGVAELELTVGEARLRLVKAHASPGASGTSGGAAPAPGGVSRPASLQAEAAEPVPSPQRRLHAVRAGFPGTFYRAPAPGEKPFVEEGDRVEDGRQIGILEAMKTMNPVEADIAGRVARIAAVDGAAVETGDLLFEIEPSS